jgi:hypothetical protein
MLSGSPGLSTSLKKKERIKMPLAVLKAGKRPLDWLSAVSHSADIIHKDCHGSTSLNVQR